MTSIKHVGVVGAGQMGRGITEVCARAGLRVTLCDVTEDRARAGLAGVADSLLKAEKRGTLTSEDRAHALAGISATGDLSHLSGANLVIEAAVEDEQAKTALFRQLDEVVTDPAAVLASNTSSIPIARLAAATGRPESVVGLHFFNPVPVMPLVEIIPSLHTSKVTELLVRAFADETLGKRTIVTQDRAGFVVNSLLVPYLLAAVRMVSSGTATAEDIDTGMTAGCAHPMGPLRLADLIGLDTVAAIGEALYEEYREPLYAPPPLLRRMVESGLLGRKSGQGFFNYQAT
ncbi:3-hydroxybutyryl-CoA dehydrogenase [Streptomyces europaeiscabiei]|uniref:3-hydroxybutyryl-CoA dehydrogenase n=1 Tax=Streptomyces TaxID=1883 RepID=UPI000A3A06BD|nr:MULTISPECIES: 3-hydroxybutyryl-CoA dehydrogenase [Streptomyces]MDX3587369.1 3-hydroxybutyryl-CoA dehydrogenase [Streptomyces europaeiscabiei]MDX3613929.1 3-hydroxybutyryl-CoA dehydrogenase [Streptomyces europaeiscabiei]MDX3636864.1 3-hydroxybutyryl-CoA dehydrogenase [Streptomyces europaeiscabiei]MDX3655089.1 3-hydroxybutyryl-CoA dehydrogenase [Streptomyces europaeiscabiei]WUD37952.1 3-hydroxybutyryl-CoA dehydrogenase [Streptomyces europaeiscabiei]